MGKKRKGIGGMIVGLFTLIIIAGFIIAVLREFDGDVIGAISWFFDYLLQAALRISEWFLDMPGFRSVFR